MAAPWYVPVEADLSDYIVDALIQAAKTKALGSGQTDPFVNARNSRTTYIRLRLSNRILVSSTPYSVPPELKDCACILIIEMMVGRLMGVQLPEAFKRRIRRAEDDLDIAAVVDSHGQCAFPITRPLDPTPQGAQVGAPSQVVTRSTRLFTANTLRGF